MYVLAPNNVVKTWPYTIYDLKKDNPEVSFPKSIYSKTKEADEILALYNVFPVSPTPVPAYNKSTEKIKEIDPKLSENVWIETWETIPLTSEEQEAEKLQTESKVRQERNQLLKDSDWTQLPDSPADSALWATYRQELRDITNQEGFPFYITWPELSENYQ